MHCLLEPFTLIHAHTHTHRHFLALLPATASVHSAGLLLQLLRWVNRPNRRLLGLSLLQVLFLVLCVYLLYQSLLVFGPGRVSMRVCGCVCVCCVPYKQADGLNIMVCCVLCCLLCALSTVSLVVAPLSTMVVAGVAIWVCPAMSCMATPTYV